MAEYTNNIANSEVSVCEWSSIDWTLKVTANDGYVFDGDIYVTYTNTRGATVQTKMKLNSAKTVASSFPSDNVDGSEQFTFTGATKADGLDITNNVENTTVTSSKSGYEATITLTANEGYVIENANVTFTDLYSSQGSEDMTVSEDGGTATWQNSECDTDSTFIISGATSSSSTQPTITNNITNSTVSFTGNSHQYVINVTADSGYSFNGTVEANYTTYSSGNEANVSFALSSDKKTASAVCPDVNENTPIVLNGETTKDAVITVVNNIDGTTETHTFDGVNFAVTVNGTVFKKRFRNAQMTYTDSGGNELTTDLTTSLVDTTPVANGSAIVKNGTVVTLVGTYEQVTLVETDLSNCTTTEQLPDALFANESLSVTLNANENTSFTNPPVFYWVNESADTEEQKLTLSSDKKQATGVFSNPDYLPSIVTVSGAATPDKTIGANYGAINVYKVTLDALKEFSKKRFFKEAINSDSSEFTLINLGDYVNRIKRLFLTVPTSSTDVILCGNYDTGVECEAPNVETITLNFGSISIPTPNGDATDYQSELQLFVPFKGFVTIPADYIGKTITLTYLVNVITCAGVAKVLCGDDTILLIDVKPNEDILYQTNLDNLATIGGDDWNEQYLYGTEPFLYMKYYNSLNKAARNNDYENAKLSDLSGFCVIDNVSLHTTEEMTKEEQTDIVELLNNGVYINA